MTTAESKPKRKAVDLASLLVSIDSRREKFADDLKTKAYAQATSEMLAVPWTTPSTGNESRNMTVKKNIRCEMSLTNGRPRGQQVPRFTRRPFLNKASRIGRKACHGFLFIKRWLTQSRREFGTRVS